MAVIERQPTTAARDGSDPLRERPAWLTDHAGTRGLRRVTPFSRPPVTGHLGKVFHIAAERAAGQLLGFDRPPDIEPGGATLRNLSAWASLVDEAAGWLHAAGVRPWDRVAIVKRNHFDINALGSACARIGAIAAPWAATHSPEHLRILLERLERPFLVTDRAQLERAQLDEETLAALTARTIVVDGADDVAGAVSLDDLRGSAPPPPRLRPDDELMLISHTSGTTGAPEAEEDTYPTVQRPGTP